LSAPGTLREIEVALAVEKPSPTFSSEMVAWFEFGCGQPGGAKLSRQRHGETTGWAEARSSSGLVAGAIFERVLNEYCVCLSMPLSVEMEPLPDFRSPDQTAEALRCIKDSPLLK